MVDFGLFVRAGGAFFLSLRSRYGSAISRAAGGLCCFSRLQVGETLAPLTPNEPCQVRFGFSGPSSGHGAFPSGGQGVGRLLLFVTC